MELLQTSFKTKKWVILLVLCGVSSYGRYKLHHLPSVSRKRIRIMKLLEDLISVTETVSDSAQTLSLLSKDLKAFLYSEADQIPNSLKQLSKIAASDEFSNSLSRVSMAATSGLIQAYYSSESKSEIQEEEEESSGFINGVSDKLMSKAGTGFVSVVVSSFARNLVLGFYSNSDINQTHDWCLKSLSCSSQWVDVLSQERSKLVMADCVKAFVSTAVAVYLERTKNFDLYDGIFSGLTNLKHQERVTDIVVYVFRGAVETLIKTSHRVLTSPSKSSDLCC